MITREEERYIFEKAYLPEHITGYVAAVSGAGPFLLGDCLCYFSNGSLTFVGYPLSGFNNEKDIKEVLDAAISRFNPELAAVIAPSLPPKCSRKTVDKYYRLELSSVRPGPKLRSIIKHAGHELEIEKSRSLDNEHIRMIDEFSCSRQLDEETRCVFSRIPFYISSVNSASVFSARDRGGRLIAFDIAELGSKDYAFYMFNFRARHNYVSGASDLLLYEIIKSAQEEEKPYLNLGLGINKGVASFKKKWGGTPFLDYEYCSYRRDRPGLLRSLLTRL